jgi:hypothetical protein
VTCSSRNLCDSSHDALGAPVYRTANYERHHSEKNGHPRNAEENIDEKNSDQRKTEENLDHPPVVPRINPRLFRERKDLGICNRSAAFRPHGGSLSMANRCRCRCAERISPARAELTYREICRRKSARFSRHFFSYWCHVRGVRWIFIRSSIDSSSRLVSTGFARPEEAATNNGE